MTKMCSPFSFFKLKRLLVQQHIIILNDNVSLYNLINEIFQSIPQTNKK